MPSGLSPVLITGSSQATFGGTPIAVAATATQLHAPDTAGDSVTYDSLYVTAWNNDTVRRTLTVIVGYTDTTQANCNIIVQIPPQTGPVQMLYAFPLRRGLPVYAVASAAPAINAAVRVVPATQYDVTGVLAALAALGVPTS